MLDNVILDGIFTNANFRDGFDEEPRVCHRFEMCLKLTISVVLKIGLFPVMLTISFLVHSEAAS